MTTQSLVLVSTPPAHKGPMRWLAAILSATAALFDELRKSRKSMSDAQKRFPYLVEL